MPDYNFRKVRLFQNVNLMILSPKNTKLHKNCAVITRNDNSNHFVEQRGGQGLYLLQSEHSGDCNHRSL